MPRSRVPDNPLSAGIIRSRNRDDHEIHIDLLLELVEPLPHGLFIVPPG